MALKIIDKDYRWNEAKNFFSNRNTNFLYSLLEQIVDINTK